LRFRNNKYVFRTHLQPMDGDSKNLRGERDAVVTKLDDKNTEYFNAINGKMKKGDIQKMQKPET